MFGLFKSFVGIMAMPLPMAFFLALVGLGFVFWGWRRAGFVSAFLATLMVVSASWGPVADRLLAPLESAHPPVLDARGLDGVCAVVVLGSGWVPDASRPIGSQLNESSVQRLVEGVRLWRQVPEARLVLSGGSRREDRPGVALGYHEAAVSLGVPEAALTALDGPLDTAQEAYAVREVLGDGAVFLLVTSASHMKRSMRHFRRAGLSPIAAPTRFKTGRQSSNPFSDWIPSAWHLRKTERAIYEYLGLIALEWDHK